MATKNNTERMLKDIKSEIERYIMQAQDAIKKSYVSPYYDADNIFINNKRIEYFSDMYENFDFDKAEVLKEEIDNRIINCERAILNTPLADRLNIESKRSILKELRYLNFIFAEERE